MYQVDPPEIPPHNTESLASMRRARKDGSSSGKCGNLSNVVVLRQAVEVGGNKQFQSVLLSTCESACASCLGPPTTIPTWTRSTDDDGFVLALPHVLPSRHSSFPVARLELSNRSRAEGDSQADFATSIRESALLRTSWWPDEPPQVSSTRTLLGDEPWFSNVFSSKRRVFRADVELIHLAYPECEIHFQTHGQTHPALYMSDLGRRWSPLGHTLLGRDFHSQPKKLHAVACSPQSRASRLRCRRSPLLCGNELADRCPRDRGPRAIHARPIGATRQSTTWKSARHRN